MEAVTNDPLAEIAAAREAQKAAELGPTDQIGRDEFMQLLVAKLNNQDPLNPSDDTEFIQQLATFSSLEQLVDVNANLESLAVGQGSIINAQALNLIGREALVEAGNQIRVKGGVADELVYVMPDESVDPTLQIVDADGTVIRTLELDGTPRGRQTIAWDGLDEDGDPVPDGDYTLRVTARDLDGEPVDVALYRALPIDGVNFINGTIALISGERELPFDQILEFRAG